jgi:hypothetical protein
MGLWEKNWPIPTTKKYYTSTFSTYKNIATLLHIKLAVMKQFIKALDEQGMCTFHKFFWAEKNVGSTFTSQCKNQNVSEKEARTALKTAIGVGFSHGLWVICKRRISVSSRRYKPTGKHSHSLLYCRFSLVYLDVK